MGVHEGFLLLGEVDVFFNLIEGRLGIFDDGFAGQIGAGRFDGLVPYPLFGVKDAGRRDLALVLHEDN